MRTASVRRRLVGAAVLLLGAGARAAPAQSLTAGTLSGVVRDTSGAPLYEAGVIATSRSTGISRGIVTPRTGLFTLPLLPAGEYDVFVERIGYRPARLTGVPVRAGRTARVVALLEDAPPPVTTVTQVPAAGGATLDSRAGVSQGFTPLAFTRLPQEQRGLSALARLASFSSSAGDLEGLPAELGGLFLDGLPFTPARHPALPLPAFDAVGFPLGSVDRAELVTGGGDVEWAGAAGGVLSGDTRRGTPRVEAHGFADWSGDVLSSSKYFDAGAAPNSSLRGALVLTGPVIQDTAAFMVGVEIQRLETPRPPAWAYAALDSTLLAIAQDSFGTDLGPYTRAGVRTVDVANAFGRFDWQLADHHGFSIRGNFASITAGDPDLGGRAAPSFGAALEGRDFSTAAALTSALGPQLASELRFGVESSTRELLRAGPPATRLVDGGLAFGADPALAGRFKRTAVRLSETAYLTRGSHHLKGGVAVAFASFDDSYGVGRGGAYWFAGTDEYGSRTGVFTQAVGPIPTAQFTTTTLAVYLQDTWSASPGFDLQAGVRYELEQIPENQVGVNQPWLDSTGIDNGVYERGHRRFSPRLALTWDVQDQHRWVVRATAGIYHGARDPGLLDEVTTHGVRFLVRRGVGSLGRWPAAPDSVAAPIQGPAITLLGPRFAAPRTGRVSLGVTRAVRDGVALHVAGAYRHTDFLPRRHDLNRLPGSTGTDQYGRRLSGTLVQQGSLLAATPGSNRRFPSFDQVTSIDVDGYSDYYGLTLALEGRAGGLEFLASYTYSRTTDNWFRGLTPFPDSLAGADWADGRSSFDAPHRAVMGAEWRVPGRLGLRVAALFRHESGPPFTPGFRDGVDANGDGSADNDPAFVDDAIAGADSIIAAWDCLRKQVGGFAQRNSCRDPSIRTLDLQLSWGIARLGGYPAELVLDALNVLESDVGIRDQALYLVDRAGTLTTDPVSGVTTVPLAANPNFGHLLARRTTGRMLRLGLRFNY